MLFLNDSHKSKFQKLALLSTLNPYDSERKSLLYLLSGNNDIFFKKKHIYNFSNNHPIFNGFNQSNVDFCSSSKSLIRLALNLFNGYTDKYTDPLNLLAFLDNNNYTLAINAIKIRFNHNLNY